jgi:AsmA protein
MARRALRIGLVIVAIVIVLVIGAGAVFVLTFNPNELKPRIIAAVKQATGRDLVLGGNIGLQLSLRPTVEVSGVSLSNAPGFSPPQMATLQTLYLQLAVLPLLRHSIEINRLVLVQPDIHLETNAQGKSNWEFTPQATTPPAAAPTSASQNSNPTPSSNTTQISIAAVKIINGVVTYHNDRAGRTTTLNLQQFTATAESPGAPLHINLDADYDGTSFNLAGVIGPLARLQNPSSTTPWPLNMTLAAAGAKVSANGTLMQPLQGSGYVLTVQGSVPSLATLAKLVPGTKLPPLQDLSFSTKIADSGKPLPQISDLTLHIGASDLSSVAAGLKIDKVDINAPGSDEPIQARGAGTFAGGPITLAATLGAPASLLAGPFPVDVKAQAAGGNFELKGAIAHPPTVGGVGLGITAQVPDLSALSPLVGHALPAIKSVALQAELNDAPGGFRQGARLRNIKLTTANGDLSGDAGVTLGQKPSFTAQLASTRMDADAVIAAAGKPVPSTRPAGSPPPAKPAPSGRPFTDRPLPFDLLRTADADIALAVQDLHAGGTDYRALNIHAVLRDGRLTVSPFAADLPGGHMSGTLTADASEANPPVALTVVAPGLDVAPLLSAARLPGHVSGTLEVHADLHGAGTSAHAIAADLSGSLGLAMQGGTVDMSLLNNLLGGVLAKANLVGLIAHGGTTELRCFATRALAQNGVATINPLLLSTAAMTVDGRGSVDLGTETLDMTLRPQGRVGGTGLVVPVQVTGPIRSPKTSVNALGAVQSNAGALAGGALRNATPFAALGKALLGGRAGGGAAAASAVSCPDALALARGGTAPAPSARPAAPASSASNTQRKLPNAGALLRQLFH